MALQTAVIQQTQYRLAQHYLKKLQQANNAFGQANGANRRHWIGVVQQDWLQIKQWQAWSASADAADDQVRLCMSFPLTALDVLRTQQTPDEQAHWLEKGLAAARKLSDDSAEKTILYRLGDQYLRLERFAEAERCARELLEKVMASGEGGIALGRAYYLLGDLSQRRGESDEAQTYYTQAQQMLRDQPNCEEMAEIWAGLGRIAFFKGDYATVYAHGLKQLEVSTNLQNEHLMGVAHLQLSGVCNHTGEKEKAIYHAEMCLRLARLDGGLRLIAHALVGLAHAEQRLDRLESAREHYEEALQMPPSVLPPSSLVSAIDGIARVCARTDDVDRALQHYQQSLAISQKHASLRYRACDTANAIIQLKIQRGDPADMADIGEYLALAVQSAFDQGTRPFLVKTLYTAAQVWRHNGQPEQAAIWAGVFKNDGHYLEVGQLDALCDALRQALGAERYDQAIAEGGTIPLDAALRSVMDLLV